MLRLANKVALVTGGGSGIGRASAIAFAREGAKVVVADVNTSGGEETVKMVKGSGGEATFIKADVTKEAEVEALVGRTVEIYGRLDCAYNNAGVREVGVPAAELSEDAWDYVMNVNLKGVWFCIKHEIPQMLKQDGGAIVNTSSIIGLGGCSDGAAYCASKHGVIGLTKAVALDYAKANIRVNAVCPGVVHTPLMDEPMAKIPGLEKNMIALHPIGRLGEPEEIAEAVVWLCSDAASFVTGIAMPVDGGYTAR